jgi:hypothetical protein
MANLLNRAGIAAMICDCLKADTAILYGPSRLVQVITHDPVLFIQAAVDINKPYKLFIWTPDNPTTAVRSQNSDEMFVLNYRIEGLAVIPETAFQTIDKIDQQIKVLINAQMFSGLYFSAYYTDAQGKVFDVERSDASIEVVKTEGGTIAAECKGGINVLINRLN